MGAALAPGCAQHYVMKLNNGSQIDAFGKPKLQGQTYHYKDARGNERVMPRGRVMELEPAFMAMDEQKSFAPPKPHKERHWYFLWLATNAPAGKADPGQADREVG